MAGNTGMTRQVDDLGRIVIPKEIRKSFCIVEGARLEISVSGKSIILTPKEEGCVVCGRVGATGYQLNGVRICKKCYQNLKEESSDE